MPTDAQRIRSQCLEQIHRKRRSIYEAADTMRQRQLQVEADAGVPVDAYAQGLQDEYAETPEAKQREALTIRFDPEASAAAIAVAMRGMADELDAGLWEHESGLLLPPQLAAWVPSRPSPNDPKD